MFGTIEKDKLIKKVTDIGNGRIVRVGYRTELPVKADFYKKGLKIIKFTEKSARVGVNYHNIRSVVERLKNRQEKDTKRKSTNNYKWVVENKVKYNLVTTNYYLQVANLNEKSNEKSKFLTIWPEEGIYLFTETLEGSPYKNCIIDSYFTKNNGISGNEIQTIKFANIYKFNDLEA